MNLRWLLPGRRRFAEPETFIWITPTLAVGSASAARSPRRLASAGVRAVLDLQQETSDPSDRFAAAGLAYLKAPVPDFGAPGQAALEQATAWVLARMANGQPVLIHCRAGHGRSVCVAMATLLRMGYTLPEAFNLVRRQQPALALSEPQLEALRTFANRSARP